MKFLQELFHGKGYIDGITIINLEGEILFTAKFNNKLGQDQGSEELVGKSFLDVYENLTPQTSTTIKAMERGTPAYVENQFLKTRGRDGITITSLSIPIKCGGRIVGRRRIHAGRPGCGGRGHEAGAGLYSGGGVLRPSGYDLRGDRHRKGSGGAGDSQCQPTQRQALHCPELRRPAGDPAGEHPLWHGQRGVHRRGRKQGAL